MPKVSDAYLAERQNEILDAATRCFADTGFHATSMADVIKESGRSAGSVYRYYKSKDDLIGAIIDRLLGAIEQQLVKASAGATTPADIVDRAIGVALRTFGEQQVYARLLPQVWTEALRNDAVRARVQHAYARILQHLEDHARRMHEAGTLAPDLDPRGVAHVMLATVQGFMLQRLLLTRNLDPDVYLSAARRIYTHTAPTPPNEPA